MITTATSGSWTIDLYENWVWHWARAWSDLGRLIEAHANEEHIEKHAQEKFNWLGAGSWCECWNCRVVYAWEHRHDHLILKAKRKK